MAEEKIDDKTVKLYLGGICTAWSNEHLKGILSQHGAVKRVDVVKHYAFAVCVLLGFNLRPESLKRVWTQSF